MTAATFTAAEQAERQGIPIIEEVARILGGKNLDTKQRHCRTFDIDGCSLWLKVDGYHRRLEVSDHYPDDLRTHAYDRPKNITLSMDRPAAAIAADIMRRFVPAARAVRRGAEARKVEADRYEAEVDGYCAELAAAVPGLKPSDSYGTDRHCLFHRSFRIGKVSITGGTRYNDPPGTPSYGRVEINQMELTVDQARRVLAIAVEDWKPEGEEK